MQNVYEEIELGVSSVAAPIRIGNIGATLSIGATGPVRRFDETRRADLGSQTDEIRFQDSIRTTGKCTTGSLNVQLKQIQLPKENINMLKINLITECNVKSVY